MTVVIPVYHGEPFILRALESVFDQNIPPWDLEVIVVDDGSPDGAAAVVEPFLVQVTGRPAVQLLRQSNRGMAAARNAGFARARGRFVAFLDQDDTWPAEKTEWQLAVLQQTPDAAAVTGRATWVDGEGRILGHYGTCVGDVDAETLFRCNPFAAPGVGLIRSDAFASVGGFDETLWGADDWDLWIRLLATGRILAFDRTALFQRQHAQQASRDLERMASNVRRMQDRILASAAVRRLPSAARRRLIRAAERGYVETYGWLHRVRVRQALKRGRLADAILELPQLRRGFLIHVRSVVRMLHDRWSIRRNMSSAGHSSEGDPRPVDAVIHVAVIADGGYVPHVEALLHSLADHHPPGSLHIDWFHIGMEERERSRIGSWCSDAGIGLEFHDGLAAVRGYDGTDLERVLQLRLRLPELLPGRDRLLFLDGDTVVADSLRALWHSDLSGKAMGGVRDHWIGSPEFLALHPGLTSDALQLYTQATYINAGVLLFDCVQWRARDLSARTIARLERGPLWLFDQDAINLECADAIHILDPRWNVHPGIYDRAYFDRDTPAIARGPLVAACARPGIVHFAGQCKPWGEPATWWLLTPLYHRYRQRSYWRRPLSLPIRLRLLKLVLINQLQRYPGLYKRLVTRVRKIRARRRPAG